MLGANGISADDAAHITSPAASIGRRPQVSTSRPAGCSSTAWTIAATAKASPVHEVGRSSTSTTNSGTSVERAPWACQPVVKLAAQASR
ncbi:hypothetical protein SDC9_210259 [bioreactor metagenome]|uniref:Uncharacterized protein n=1 Tax=bioreactor metagenome TaxID=1076179 RepID=A0A645JHC7_9ZZZZ